MAFQRIFHHVVPSKSKKKDLYVASVISCLIIFQIHHNTVRRENLVEPPLPGAEIDSHRSSVLLSQCNHSNISSFNTGQPMANDLIKRYPWLNGALFPVQSQSLLYCAIPKIASKTLISIMVYVYVRDILDNLSQNLTHRPLNKTQAGQLINIPKLTEQLLKNGIPLPHTTEPNFVVTLLQTFLHLLRYETVNSTSAPVFMNPWRLSLHEIFRGIQFNTMSNISQIFSPSFTRALFVRHPFERLASAYKERIATLQKDRIQAEPHYDSVRKIICRRHTQFSPAFSKSQGYHPCEDYIPSFEQFIRFILPDRKILTDVMRMDGHWKPYTMICQVCQLKYNFIGKYETFNEDFTILLKRLNIADWKVQKRRGASGYTTWQYQQLYSSLPNDLICRLKDFYRDDLEFFNYRVEEYINRTSLVC